MKPNMQKVSIFMGRHTFRRKQHLIDLQSGTKRSKAHKTKQKRKKYIEKDKKKKHTKNETQKIVNGACANFYKHQEENAARIQFLRQTMQSDQETAPEQRQSSDNSNNNQ